MAPTRKLLVASAVALVLSGCDSSSSSSSGSSTTSAQAIDGYLVNSNVMCDDEPGAAPTAAAGRFECPTGTELYTISGGSDVGFDETATSGGETFVGELQAPGTLDFVTPLSTIAVNLASNDEGFDPAAFDAAVEELAAALGFTDAAPLDLNAAMSQPENLALAKKNAQVQELIAEFASITDEYKAVMKSFSAVIKNSASTATPISLSGDGLGDTMLALNTDLQSSTVPALAKTDEELSESVESVKATNDSIEEAEDVSAVPVAAREEPVRNQALSINRSTMEVFVNTDDGNQNSYSLAQFESSTKSDEGHYTVQVPGIMDQIGFKRNAVTVAKDLSNTVVGLGFKVDATDAGDARELSLTVTGARLSMSKGDSRSIVVTVEDGTPVKVVATEADGSKTEAQWTQSGVSVFSSTDNFVEVNLGEIQNRLEDKGIDGFLDETGNYKMTVVVGGVEVALTGSGVSAAREAVTVTTSGEAVTGRGFVGYVSYTN